MLPILFQSSDLTLYSYPLMMGLGWGVAYQIFFGLFPQDVPRRHAMILFWGIFLFAWIGSKVLFYFTVPVELTESILLASSFWLGGGFVFYGGFIGALIFLQLYRSFELTLNLSVLWPMVPALTIGHAIGRIGCGLAGCCYGAITEWWWGITMHGHSRHPTQFLEAGALLILGLYLLKSKSSKSVLIIIYLLTYGTLRISIEALRGDAIRGYWGLLTPSQWISLGLIISGFFLLWRVNKNDDLRGTRA